jgi:hypothetical protein
MTGKWASSLEKVVCSLEVVASYHHQIARKAGVRRYTAGRSQLVLVPTGSAIIERSRQ